MMNKHFMCMSLLLSSVLTLIAGPGIVAAEEASKWEPYIIAFENVDAEYPPGTGEILFLGSSSIRLWKTEAFFPQRTIINRGFGGAETSDVLEYFDRLVPKYQPRTIVFYCGDNDIAKQKTPEQVIADFVEFHERVSKEVPRAKILYLPIKPSIKRWEMWPLMSEVNRAVAERAHEEENLIYCDTASLLLDKQTGQPMPGMFADDGLHLNEQGYAAWTKLVEQALKELDKSTATTTR